MFVNTGTFVVAVGLYRMVESHSSKCVCSSLAGNGELTVHLNLYHVY